MPPSSLISSSRRPLALAMRADLEVQRQTWQGREYRLVKDPLTLKYFRFEEEEFAILEMLDGRTSIHEICERFELRFAPQRVKPAELQSLLVNLHRSNLVLANAPGQDRELLARAQQRQRQAWLGALASLLSFRFRGIDPDRMLARLDRYAGWLFSLPAAACSAALILSALALLGAELDVVRSRLPGFQAFFAAQNWMLLAITLAITKILHEFGHGLACKRFGGQCHEMGLMLLVFTPCLYCNVSDAWMIPSRWRRAAIAAAGMYVELNLAAIATFVWWFTQPGLVNHLCLNVMFVCSVSTLVFNGNPLLRYDGYYILADLAEIPNLRQKSSAVLQRWLAGVLLGVRMPRDPFLPARHTWLFAAYAVASAVYGWLVSLSIFWFLYQVLEPYGLKVLGQMLALSMIVGLVVMPVVRLSRFLLQPARMQHMNWFRAGVGLAAAAGVLAAVLAVPIPYEVPCSLEIQPRGATSVYVEVPGQVRRVHLQSGPVAAGQPIVDLDDVEARLAHERLAGQREVLAARVEGIRQRAHTDDEALLELSQAEEALAAIDVQLANRRNELARLKVVAPASGHFVPPASRPKNATEQVRLAAWSGRPLELHNVGAHFEASTLLGKVIAPGSLEAILVVPQEEMDFVHVGQSVELFLNQLPGERFRGQIDHISTEEVKAASARLSSRTGGEVATRTTADGLEKPLSVLYQASVSLDDPDLRIALGGTGQAKICAGHQTLAARLWRAACRTFRFQM
jgi:putative peptide zinc metalloprotease protein